MRTTLHAPLRVVAALLFATGLNVVESAVTSTATSANPCALRSNGEPVDAHFFPIAVWLQSPRNATRYREAGINVYVGLWRGPTSTQLAELKAAGMALICHQNDAALRGEDSSIVIGWMHGDEPDNAQPLRGEKGYGPPITPQKIIEDYQRIRAADPTRPVLLNLGQGVAWDNYIGRGVRRNHPEDYPEYLKGCDIGSFDIYPVVHDAPEVAGKLEFVAAGVERLTRWSDKMVWNCIECTRISNPAAKATPDQIRAEVWMSLIHGSRGLIYFVHQFKPTFNEAALLDDPENLAAVTAINRQIRELAPVLNSPTVRDGVKVTGSSASTGTDAPRIAMMQKRLGKLTYLFTVNMANQPVRGVVTLAAKSSRGTVEVLSEGRSLKVNGGEFTDEYKPYEVHLYSIVE